MTPEQFSEICKLDPEESAALKEILKNPELVEWANQIAAQCFIPETAGEEPELPEGDDLSKAWFAAAYFGADAAMEHYRKKGFPQEVLFDSMTDITAWLRNTKRNYGVIGLRKGRSWQVALFSGTVIRRGRLECNSVCIYDKELSDRNGNLLLRNGDPLINLHIPEDGPMDMESCGKSMKMMSEFFAENKPDYDWKGFHCTSWLLDPLLLPMLQEGSNILKFSRLGYTYPVDIKSDTQFRVFGTTDPEKVENPTSLQRKAAEFLKNGGVFLEGGLFIPRKNIESADYDLEKLLEANKNIPLNADCKKAE